MRRGIVVGAALLAGALAAAPATSGETSGSTFDDAFAYCSAVGTIDTPDARYTGPAVPEAIARGLEKAFGVEPGAPLAPFERGTSWRCMNGSVWACNVGANLPCMEKPDFEQQPTEAMRAYCEENPGADFLPMYVTGHATLFQWSCVGTEIRRGARTTQLDARGYIASIWHRIPPPR